MTDVRAARPGDAAALAGLATQLGYPADEGAVARRLSAIVGDDVGISLVALAADGSVCGFARALPQHFVVEESFVELAALVVADAVRGLGVGAALLARVEAWAREQGFFDVRVRSNVIRGRAHRFYLREGYVEAKRQVVFSKPTG
ncbi:MAG: GNAT family N-acetyltransferase [Rhodanobacteraceae bacterium]